MTSNSGATFVGTGWLISPRTVITAGHCVYSSFREGGEASGPRNFASKIRVTPGLSGTSTPFNSQTCFVSQQSNPFRTTKGWKEGYYNDSDVGAIILPDEFVDSAGNGIGHFGYAAPTDGELRNLLVNVSGYPGEDSDTQYWHDGAPGRIEPTYFLYNIDTTGGQSGSPVFYLHDTRDEYYVVGVHNAAEPRGVPFNHAVRFDDATYDLVQSWSRLGGGQ
ncbi:MAG: trypsin-like serine peptidase [Planctomycetia bacterium]